MAEAVATGSMTDPGERGGDALQRGARLGRYELLVPIAVGGMARVWAARQHGQRGFTKLVAIKTVLPHLATDPEFERMLVDEARIASGVRHPNVCEIYELGEEQGTVYIAMEWVSGDSLSALMKAAGGSGLDPRLVARIVSDAAAGLHAAHNLVDENGAAVHVVHRDVSPHNLLVSIDGNVKVTDFGVAKAAGASHQATVAGQLKGKISFMAPEQAQGGEVDRRSDVFALGCVLYAATTGVPPFRGEGEHQVMQELVKGAFLAPSRVVRGYPFELERIVTRALAAQPLHRFQTMEQMRVALEEWIAKSGPVVTHSHVAALVLDKVGAEVEKRRERIRLASVTLPDAGEALSSVNTEGGRLSATPSGVVPSRENPLTPAAGPRASYVSLSEVAALPPPTQAAPPPRAPSATQYFMASALGVLAAAALGTAVFNVWHTMTPPAPTTPAVNSGADPVPAVSPVVSPVAPAAPPVPAPAIRFKIIPESAYFVIDGQPLAPDVRALVRPAAGGRGRWWCAPMGTKTRRSHSMTRRRRASTCGSIRWPVRRRARLTPPRTRRARLDPERSLSPCLRTRIEARMSALRRSTLLLAASTVLLCAGLAPEARAADPAPDAEPATEAREQYQAGMQAYQAKRFAEAALHFEAAAAQKPHAVTLYTAALAWDQANRPDRAADDFGRALDVAGPGLSAAQTQNARERLAMLERTLGTVDAVAPEGWRLQIDSATEVPTPARLHALPGVHALAGVGPNGVVQRKDVSLEAGKVAHAELAPPVASTVPTAPVIATHEVAPVAEPPPHVETVLPPSPTPSLRQLAGMGVAGVGVGILVGGIVLGTSALKARDAYNAAPSRVGYDHAKALATWTDVAWIAGGVLAASGVALVVWPEPHHAGDVGRLVLVPTGTGAALRGTF